MGTFWALKKATQMNELPFLMVLLTLMIKVLYQHLGQGKVELEADLLDVRNLVNE